MCGLGGGWCKDTCVSVHTMSSVRTRCVVSALFIFFFQAEDGIRDLVRSRGLGDVYKRQGLTNGPMLRSKR